MMEFIGHYTSLSCAPVRSCDFPGVPMCSRVFSMNPNWPLFEIISLCYGIKLSFVVDLPIPCALNVIALS